MILAASALNITASAYSDYASGVYRGKNYNASLYVCKDYARANFTYAGGGEVFNSMVVTWHKSNSAQTFQTKVTDATGSNGRISTTWDVYDLNMFINKATAKFNVKFGTVCSLAATSY